MLLSEFNERKRRELLGNRDTARKALDSADKRWHDFADEHKLCLKCGDTRAPGNQAFCANCKDQ